MVLSVKPYLLCDSQSPSSRGPLLIKLLNINSMANPVTGCVNVFSDLIVNHSLGLWKPDGAIVSVYLPTALTTFERITYCLLSLHLSKSSIHTYLRKFPNNVVLSSFLKAISFSQCTVSVSYTHLDVYKRQVMYGSPYRFFYFLIK